MTSTLVALLAIGAFSLFWSASRLAAETARRAGRLACERAGVQLLDQTVMLSGVSLRRDRRGRLRVLRRYSFDYSREGSDRERGALALLGNELQWISEPGANATVAPRE
jgi:hypothetical protein